MSRQLLLRFPFLNEKLNVYQELNVYFYHVIFSTPYLLFVQTNFLTSLSPFFFRIHLKASENKMNAQNLAVVFAPTLMKSPCEDGSLIHDLPLQRNLIEYLILFHDSIFK